MDFSFDTCFLSADFYAAYPASQYPEIMRKDQRPYTCLLIETHDNHFICIPFRSSIKHNDAFLFTNTSRSSHSRSGLDYKKVVIIKDLNYIDSNTVAIVDNDEYVAMITNIKTIVTEVEMYIKTYVNHITGINKLHQREFARHYQFSTLPYFHDVLQLENKNI